MNETVNKKTLFILLMLLPIGVLLGYLSWEFRGERKNQTQIDDKFGAYARNLESIAIVLKTIDSNPVLFTTQNYETHFSDLLVQAEKNLRQAFRLQESTPKVFWVNALDVIFSSDKSEAAYRSEILEHCGFSDYRRASYDKKFFQREMRILQGEKVNLRVSKYQPISIGVLKFIELKANTGVGVDYILSDANFDSFARSLSLADAAANSQITSIRYSTEFKDQEKQERIKHLQTVVAEEKIRAQYAVLDREK